MMPMFLGYMQSIASPCLSNRFEAGFSHYIKMGCMVSHAVMDYDKYCRGSLNMGFPIIFK